MEVVTSTSAGQDEFDSEGEEEEVLLEEDETAPPPQGQKRDGQNGEEGSSSSSLPIVCNRYTQTSRAGIELILSCLSQRLHNAGNQSTWQVIVTLVELCTVSTFRMLALQHLQKWLHSPALSMYARSLLTALVSNTNTESPEDFQAVEGVLSLRLKTSQQAIYQESLVLLIQKRHAFFRQTVKHFLMAEVANPSSSGLGAPKSALAPSENLLKVLAALLQSVAAHSNETR